MKRRLMLALLTMMLLLSAGAHAERALPENLNAVLDTLYVQQGFQIQSATSSGNTAAVIVKSGSKSILSVLSCKDSQWTVDFENDHAVCDQSSVLLDTDDLLILSNPNPVDTEHSEQYYFELRDGQWIMTSTILYENLSSEFEPIREYIAWLDGDFMYTSCVYSDENDNTLMTRQSMPLPMVLTKEELLLSAFDRMEPSANGMGYLTDDSMSVSDDILQRLFLRLVSGDYTYVDGFLRSDGVQFIADKPDQTRVLLCCEVAYNDLHIIITESTPLPTGTVMGIENFVDTLNLGLQYYGCRVCKNSVGTWGAKQVESFTLGACFASEGSLWSNSSPAIGTVPWNDITKIDWTCIPKTLDEAKAMLDPSGWATPNNPNPADRLHLRSEPDKTSASLGKYLNGTPVKVLKRGSEWTQVRIGSTVGYMMTKYLVFGNAVNKVKTALITKQNLHPLTEIYWEGNQKADLLTGYEVSELVVIGAIGDSWYLVWDPWIDRYGKIRQSELWDGNG